MDPNTIKSIEQLLHSVRKQLMRLYNDDLQGQCVFASEVIAIALKFMGLSKIQTIAGWCIYDDPSSCSDAGYDPHTWVEIWFADKIYYLDVTADQFNYWMFPEHRFPGVIFQEGLPYGMSHKKPLE